MEFRDLVDERWLFGKRGNEKVNLKEGIDNIFSIANKVEAERQAAKAKGKDEAVRE